MIIHIVTASQGEYDDYHKWNVKAFSTQEAAQNFIDSFPKINYDALEELRRLRYDFANTLVLEMFDYTNWTDEMWEENDRQADELDKKAILEIQAKYPDADLTINEDFYGYKIEEVELEGLE